MIGGILACVDGLGRASDKLVGTMPLNTAMWIDTHCHLDAPQFGAHHALAVSLRERTATAATAAFGASLQAAGRTPVPSIARRAIR